MTKTGRNELCPCGSGKKYKKCCGSAEHRDQGSYGGGQISLHPDEYEKALDPLTAYFDVFMEQDGEAEELAKEAAWFEELYEPGTEEGVPDVLFIPWLYFDVSFGTSGRTLCERFMESQEFADLPGRTAVALRRMSESYSAFYRAGGIHNGHLMLRELGTGRKWEVSIEDEDDLSEPVKGEVLYDRLVGPVGDACSLGSPWILDDETAENAEDLLEARWAEAKDHMTESTSEEGAFGRFSKELLSFWVGFINGQIDLTEDDGPEGSEFRILNTEGHVVRFCEVIFRIGDKSALMERLTASPGFEFDEGTESWTWTGEEFAEEGMDEFSPRRLATLFIRDDRLVGETNSEERAHELIEEVEEAAAGAASFERTNITDLDLSDANDEKPGGRKTKKRKR